MLKFTSHKAYGGKLAGLFSKIIQKDTQTGARKEKYIFETKNKAPEKRPMIFSHRALYWYPSF